MRCTKFFLLFLLFPSFVPLYAQSKQFGARVDMGVIESGDISEASGIAASRRNPGVLWTHNDSGKKSAYVYAFDTHGRHLGRYLLAGAQNRDWEDMAVGPGPDDEQYLYLGNIGDNSSRYDKKYIYRVREPLVSVGQAPVDSVLYGVERLVYQYADGNRNAETLMLDPVTRDIFVVSKEALCKAYVLHWPYTFYPQPTFHVDTLHIAAPLPFRSAVGGDISADGGEILIKRTNVIYYWRRGENRSIGEALAQEPEVVSYIREPQGEAVCWAADLSGYYTLSEGRHPHLYFYPRVSAGVDAAPRLPRDFVLRQNTPNPFNPGTTIRYRLAHDDVVELTVVDLAGRRVATPVRGRRPAGEHAVVFNGEHLPSGVYFCVLRAGGAVQRRKMLLVK